MNKYEVLILGSSIVASVDLDGGVVSGYKVVIKFHFLENWIVNGNLICNLT